jgi:hypothetical protein
MSENYSPESVEKYLKYLKNQFPDTDLHLLEMVVLQCIFLDYDKDLNKDESNNEDYLKAKLSQLQRPSTFPHLRLPVLLYRLGFAQKKPSPVYEDSQACIEWGNNVIRLRERAKHIDNRKHFAHEEIHNGEMRLAKVPTKGLHLQQCIMCAH